MKKLLISAACVLSLVGFASAQTSTSTDQVPPALPAVITTGSSTVDTKVKALRKEYETKIKALQQEYLGKLKAIIGERVERKMEKKGERMNSSSTRPVMAAQNGSSTGQGGTMRPPKGLEHTEGTGKVEGTSTEGRGMPNGNAWGFFRKFFGF